ncbi:electron transfer flavoprotein subunit alpha/FixB family protein [bacterium]|nr:electron transfer flavoprotein subunit alpha/FixB family protein [bacterium]
MAVLVYIENWEGKFKKQSKELVTYAADTAAKLGTELVAVSIGNVDAAEIETLSAFGLSKVLTITGEAFAQFKAKTYANALHAAVQHCGAKVIVLGNTYNGKSMGPRIAAKLEASLVTGAISLPDTDNGFVVKKAVFSNKGFAFMDMQHEYKVLTLNVNAYHIEEKSGAVAVEDISDKVATAADVQVLNVEKQTGKIPLTEAELVVSAGRGLKGPENWGMIEELADLIGAGTACSKPVSDVGWRPHSEHVGQTGITISPNLYIAVGISGAIQHLAGVSSSKVICVINKDPEAPFFAAADYGIVGDAFEVVPKLIEAVKNIN